MIPSYQGREGGGVGGFHGIDLRRLEEARRLELEGFEPLGAAPRLGDAAEVREIRLPVEAFGDVMEEMPPLIGTILLPSELAGHPDPNPPAEGLPPTPSGTN
jgi:hypothetical protein